MGCHYARFPQINVSFNVLGIITSLLYPKAQSVYCNTFHSNTTLPLLFLLFSVFFLPSPAFLFITLLGLMIQDSPVLKNCLSLTHSLPYTLLLTFIEKIGFSVCMTGIVYGKYLQHVFYFLCGKINRNFGRWSNKF